jgi:hypothetical protein
VAVTPGANTLAPAPGGTTVATFTVTGALTLE